MKYITVSTILRVIAAGMLFYALTPKLPYEYFTVLRFVVCVVCAYLVYVSVTAKNYLWMIIGISLIVLFNPLILFPIKRPTWQVIDVVVAVALLVSIPLVRELRQAA
jgi:sensor histidine kinase YesM